MTTKPFPVIVCVVVFLLSTLGQLIVLRDALGDHHIIQIINRARDTLHFDYTPGEGERDNFIIKDNQVWTLSCSSEPEISIYGVAYSLRCGNTYVLHWNAANGRLDVARLRD